MQPEEFTIENDKLKGKGVVALCWKEMHLEVTNNIVGMMSSVGIYAQRRISR